MGTNKKFFKNKTSMIVSLLIFSFLIWGFIYLGSLDYSKKELDNAEKMHFEYSDIEENNVFIYMNSSDVFTYMKNKNIILLFGVKNSSWVGTYAKMVNEVAKEVGINEVYYYDVEEDRENNNATYESIVNYFENYTTVLDNGETEIYGPTMVIKVNGEVILFDDTTSIMKGYDSSDKYWNDYRIEITRLALKDAMEAYKNGK